jgi:hypothetical protein
MEIDFKQCELPDDCKHFRSWSEFVEWIEENQNPANDGVCCQDMHSGSGSRMDGGYKWTLGLDFKDSIKMAHAGWAKGMEKAESIASPIVDKITGQIERSNVVYDVEGEAIDIGAYLSNDPECFMRMENETVTSPCNSPKLVSIVCNVSPSAAVNAESIVNKGAHVMALVRTLEFAGHRVEVSIVPWAFSANYQGRPVAGTVVTIKQFDEPLDPALTIFALAHPAVSRRFGFLTLENMSREAQKKAGVGFGYPCNLKTSADIVIDSQVGLIDMTWIIRELEKQGITLQKQA